MSQAAMDLNAFAEMKDLMGDTFIEIISMCLESLPEQNDKLAIAISNNDTEQIFNAAHRLKSSCGSIGAFGLAEKAEVIERISREGSTQGINAAYSDLQLALEEVLTHLKNENK